VLTWVSTPVLDFSCLHLQCHSNSSFNQLLSKYNPAKSCELISNFIKQYPVSLTLPLHSNWGCNRGCRVKLGAKDRVTLKIIIVSVSQCILYTPLVPSPFEWGLLGVILSPKNVRFELRDQDSVSRWDICNLKKSFEWILGYH